MVPRGESPIIRRYEEGSYFRGPGAVVAVVSAGDAIHRRGLPPMAGALLKGRGRALGG